MTKTARRMVEDALGPQRTKTLWTANYYPALPITPQDFDPGALLPAMLYMARWGHRRGRGRFAATFARDGDSKAQPAVCDVVDVLLGCQAEVLCGFDDETGRAMLGDMLLAWCLENKKHEQGHSEDIQRIYPTHYLASWLDLPGQVSSLRMVPELLTALLADQQAGEWLQAGSSPSSAFPIGASFTDNALLTRFGRYMAMRGPHSADRAGDVFLEEAAADIGIDELLTIRLAQTCASAPGKLRGAEGSSIPNRWPLARRAAAQLRDDLAVFIQVYGAHIPRQAFLQMLEAIMGLGMTRLLFSTYQLLDEWERSGVVPDTNRQSSMPLFVDASCGQDDMLRCQSEGVMADVMRRFARLPVFMTLLRILEERIRNSRHFKENIPPDGPDATTLINLLGMVYREKHPHASFITDALEEDCARLANELEAEGEMMQAEALRKSTPHPGLRLAECLCVLMGEGKQGDHYLDCLESALMSDQPHGLTIKRPPRRSHEGSKRAPDRRAIILSVPLLEALVHRHLDNTSGHGMHNALSLPHFLAILREDYGLYINEEPRGVPISQELLQRNKTSLERRLRDLGLLIGVNDAENMKRLQGRYHGDASHAAPLA